MGLSIKFGIAELSKLNRGDILCRDEDGQRFELTQIGKVGKAGYYYEAGVGKTSEGITLKGKPVGPVKFSTDVYEQNGQFICDRFTLANSPAIKQINYKDIQPGTVLVEKKTGRKISVTEIITKDPANSKVLWILWSKAFNHPIRKGVEFKAEYLDPPPEHKLKTCLFKKGSDYITYDFTPERNRSNE